MTPIQLLAYADRCGGTLAELAELLDGPLRVFSGVHILPFFVPFDGDDAGFDPTDHSAVDPRLGSWADVERIAARRDVTADLIVNHVSASSAQFTDWLARQQLSEHEGMFLTFDGVFPGGATEEQITAFYRPRPGLPFTAYRAADGRRRLVWTTFLPSQVDLDVRHPAAVAYLTGLLRRFRDAGIGTVRLDAVGYAVKTAGTDSFMTEQTLAFVREITALARNEGLRVLVEVHAHYSQQLAIAPLVDLVYDFALAPLLLHSLGTGTVDRLIQWIQIRPENAITVLDTHDGIGIIDAGPSGEREGLLSFAEMADIFSKAAAATGGHSAVASVVPAWAVLPHQINATFLSTLGGDAQSYLTCRAVQFFLPGIPQVYYVGLLGGLDDEERFRRTGVGRDVNRAAFTVAEVQRALAGDIPQAIVGLARLRSSHPAFDGDFRADAPAAGVVRLRWVNGGASAELVVEVASRVRFALQATDSAENLSFGSVAELAQYGRLAADSPGSR